MDHPQVDNASWNGECVTYWKRCSALEGYEVTERLLSEQVGCLSAGQLATKNVECVGIHHIGCV